MYPTVQAISQLANHLPPLAQAELLDFAQFLTTRYLSPASVPKYLSQTWAGGLQEYSGQYSALELQKKALEWRRGNVPD